MQVVIGYLIGYAVIAFVLLPLYYRLNLTSIYHYLQQRFGSVAYKTGALFFIISRTVGATARLYLVINVLQFFILDKMDVPFVVTAAVILLMILLYTFEGGVKTIVYTDTLQTSLMVSGLIICIGYILYHLNLSAGDALTVMKSKGYLNVFNTDINSKGFFLKQIIGGAFILSNVASGNDINSVKMPYLVFTGIFLLLISEYSTVWRTTPTRVCLVFLFNNKSDTILIMKTNHKII